MRGERPSAYWSEAKPSRRQRRCSRSKHTFGWTENGVDLYDILDRVSCWCCCNKNLKELRNIWRYLPEYWERLINLQERIECPFKKYKNRKYGEYGDLRTLQKIFEQEEK